MDIIETFELNNPIYISNFIFSSPLLIKGRYQAFNKDLKRLFEEIEKVSIFKKI